MKFLLDTNIVSRLVRRPDEKDLLDRISEVGESRVCTSIVVAAELRYGAEKKKSPRLSAQLHAVLRAMEIVPFEVPADITYGQIRARLEYLRTPIGANDLLIAAQVITLGYTLVTDNEREFGRVAGLKCENWLRD
jgi:tRNA(fMet)-specific endonuclease VapC